jgi:Z1 domain
MPLQLNGHFYTTFLRAHGNFPAQTLLCAQETIEKLNEHAATSDHPGMMFGKVQSGKTRSFITSMALAFDNGFDVSIVLTKNSVALLDQTYKRLRFEFNNLIREEELQVFKIGGVPTNLTAFDLNSKMVVVANKQTNQLRRLQKLFTEQCPALLAKRTLIIDDEADNASVGYSSRQGMIEANRTAKEISQLRDALPRSSLLQVTATPYSLYRQPTKIKGVNNVVQFMPLRPAFTVPVPVGEGYIGGDTYFGPAAMGNVPTIESLIHYPVNPSELDRLEAADILYNPETLLTSELYHGIRSAFVNFLVGGVILRINAQHAGQNLRRLKYAFLIHTEMSKASHEWQSQLINQIKELLRDASIEGDPIFSELVTGAYENLSQSLQMDQKPVPPVNDVLVGVRGALMNDEISITVVNSEKKMTQLLDEESGELRLSNPFSIFVGGQAIDRGITIANLLAFYYGRNPRTQQQDTVMQHSRMYGYRRTDLAVTRFYTTPQIRHSMAEMEIFDNFLRESIENGGQEAAVQFIHRSADGKIIECNPSKVLASKTQTLKSGRRILPVGFKTHPEQGENGIGETIHHLEHRLVDLCGLGAARPAVVSLEEAVELLDVVASTMFWERRLKDMEFSWDTAKAALQYLSKLHPDPDEKGKVLLWAVNGRNITRSFGVPPNESFADNPDAQTEAQLWADHAIDRPILFMLGQNGSGLQGWGGTPFYWPVIRAQANTPRAVYTEATLDD